MSALQQLLQQAAGASSNFVNKLFLNVDKDNAAQVFGYRIRFLPGKKQAFKERPERPLGELGLTEIRNVSYRYEPLPAYFSKRRILRPALDQSPDRPLPYRKRKTHLPWVYFFEQPQQQYVAVEVQPVLSLTSPAVHAPPVKSQSMKTSSETPSLQGEVKLPHHASICDDSFIATLQDRQRPVFKAKPSP